MRVRAGRSRAIPRPQWGTLHALAALMLGALAAVEIGGSPGLIKSVLECGLALGGFGAMAVWTRRNRTALDQQDWCDCAGATVTMRVIHSHRPEPARLERAHEPTLAEALEEVAP